MEKPRFCPELAPLAAHETNVSPNEISSRILYVVSDWVDLASPDPYVTNVAKQVFLQEITYAGFCGATNILLRYPEAPDRIKARSQISNFSDAVRQASQASPSVSISILLRPTADIPEKPDNRRSENGTDANSRYSQRSENLQKDSLSSWDVWHSIRTACKYDNRISLGIFLLSLSLIKS